MKRLPRPPPPGDPEALDALAERVLPSIRRWALAFFVDPVAADDAVQEALVRLLKSSSKYDPALPLRPWLRTLVRNACADVHRRRARGGWSPLPERGVSTDPARRLDLDRGARTGTRGLGCPDARGSARSGSPVSMRAARAQRWPPSSGSRRRPSGSSSTRPDAPSASGFCRPIRSSSSW